MQFMSQSTGWADNIILAMVPLGVLTAIVGAIRVGGPSWLKAIIGRARESRAVAESELMSSTSNEVCELWNGQQIVRVMGSGPIREFIILLPEGSGESQDPEKTPVVSVRPATSGAGSSPVGADQDVRAMRLGEESDDKLDQSPDKVWREYLEKYSKCADVYIAPILPSRQTPPFESASSATVLNTVKTIRKRSSLTKRQSIKSSYPAQRPQGIRISRKASQASKHKKWAPVLAPRNPEKVTIQCHGKSQSPLFEIQMPIHQTSPSTFTTK
jgi:hypothetical protein